MTRRACGFAGDRSAEKFKPAETRPAANSGRGFCVGAWLPLRPSVPCAGNLGGGAGRPFGRKGAPHSSQYCEPSRFSVLHLSQVIIVEKQVILTRKGTRCT